jgi:hypothetical protein
MTFGAGYTAFYAMLGTEIMSSVKNFGLNVKIL